MHLSLSLFGPLLSSFAAYGFWSLCKSFSCLCSWHSYWDWQPAAGVSFQTHGLLRHLKVLSPLSGRRCKQSSSKLRREHRIPNRRSKGTAFRHLNQTGWNGLHISIGVCRCKEQDFCVQKLGCGGVQTNHWLRDLRHFSQAFSTSSNASEVWGN